MTTETQAPTGKARPSQTHQPVLALDGDKWCALWGPDLQEGIVGFGATPEEALAAFDVEFNFCEAQLQLDDRNIDKCVEALQEIQSWGGTR